MLLHPTIEPTPRTPRLRALAGLGDRDVHPYADPELVALVRGARAGDHGSWAALVRRFDGRLRGIAGSYRLGPADVDDVVQSTWLELLEHVDTVREPAAIGAWLATTTRRTAMRVLRRRLREQPVDEPQIFERAGDDDAEQRVLAAERRQIVGRAVAALSPRQRRLMALLASEPARPYSQIGAALDIPVGSIGPTRGRCIDRLRRDPGVLALCGAGAGSGRISGLR